MTARILSRISLMLLLGFSLSACNDDEREVSILWDDSGVPHVYAQSEQQLLYGLGWAHMRDHGNRLLRLYTVSRGRAAETLGRDYLASDQHVWRMGIPETAAQHYQHMDENERKRVEMYAQAINDYAAAHPQALDTVLKQVLPITGQDVLQHIAYTLYTPDANYLQGTIQRYQSGASASPASTRQTPLASNGWVLGPQKSASGKAMLLSNTHFPWPNLPGYEHLLWHEIQLRADDIDVYGVGIIGLPALTIGFNETKAWTVTAAGAFDQADVYELIRQDGGYMFEGRTTAFVESSVMLLVKEDDGTLSEAPLQVKRSIHGPVFFETATRALAIRYLTPERLAGSELWDMARADTPEAFLAAMSPQNMIPLNILYADRNDNILYTIMGQLPDRRGITPDTREFLPGDTAANIWSGKLPFERIPKIINPPSGYLQNANEPPWSTTRPAQLDRADYPWDWPQPRISLRAAQSLKLIDARTRFTLDEFIADKFTTHSELADRVLDDLITAAQASGDPNLQGAAQVLADWDRNYDTQSVGAVLFTFWTMVYTPGVIQGQAFPDALYDVPYDMNDELNTPYGLADPVSALAALAQAEQIVRGSLGSLYVPWGDMLRFQLYDWSLPAFGAPGSYGVFSANVGIQRRDEQPGLTVASGDTWVFAIDFADPNAARAVMSYGNASQPGSGELGDQLALYAEKRMRPVWRTRAQVEAHLQVREELRPPASPEASR